MKSFKQHIYEKLKVSVKNTINHTLFPETKDELFQMINDEIYKNGHDCSLNHIDVSKITDMAYIFKSSIFNGDISGWDVSNVENMEAIFFDSNFNGDISDWDVSNVKNMSFMFNYSPLKNNPPKWYKK